MSANQETKRPSALNWDFSRTHTTGDVGWPAERKEELLSFEPDVVLSMKLTPDRFFQERLSFLVCERRGDEIYYVKAHTRNKDVQEAYEDARRLAEYWKFDSSSLDAWYKRRKEKAADLDERFETMRNDLIPALALRILHSFDDARPWYIAFEVTWEAVPSSSGRSQVQ